MKKLFQENGNLKSIIFIIAIAIPLGLIVAYALFLLNWYFSGGIELQNVSFFLILCWIFFGTSAKDFFGQGKNGNLEPKHTVMISSLLFNSFISSTEQHRLFYGLVSFYFLSWILSGKLMSKGYYWEYEFPIENLSKNDVVEAIKKEFFVIKSTQRENSFMVKGFGLWSLKTTFESQGSRAWLRVEPMNSGLTFCIILKVMPGSVGQYYGEKVLKNLGISAKPS